MKRIQKAKGIKIAGTASMDTFSNELTVMANTIIETEGIKKEIRQDNSEVKRVGITYAYTNESNGCNDFCKRFNKKSHEMGNEINSNN